MQFIFFYIGTSTTMPEMLVSSIRKYNLNSKIVHLTDLDSPEVAGVDECYRIDGEKNNLMTFRLKAHASYPINDVSVYLDCDMLAIRKFDLKLNGKQIIVCRREFNKSGKFNINIHGMNLQEHSGKSLDQVYPYLACFVMTKNNAFWINAYEHLLKLDEKYHFWYGDQEVIRGLISDDKSISFGIASEAKVACLPEFWEPKLKSYFLHFKGPRKHNMLEWFNLIQSG